MSSFDVNDRVMTAHLPAKRVFTIYSLIGESLFLNLDPRRKKGHHLQRNCPLYREI
jgi:hypothetical protein